MERYFILMIILVASFLFFKSSRIEGMQNCSKTTIYHFLHTQAASKYPQLVSEFGEPNTLVDQPYGAAIWRGTEMFESIMLLDEAIGHMEPFSHCDCVYATIRVHIPDNFVSTILNLSKSIYYDRLKKTLTVRCHSMAADVATLWLALTMLKNPSESDVIAKEFENAIRASEFSVNYAKMSAELKQMIRDNQTMYSKELEKQECVFMYASGQSSSLMR